jgi:hypothetical protein
VTTVFTRLTPSLKTNKLFFSITVRVRESLKIHDMIEPNLDLNAHSSYPETGEFGFKISNALHEYDLFYPSLIKMYVGRVPYKKH